MTDSIKLFLIKTLLSELDDTSICYKPVEALSYRYKGRYNRSPRSPRYNVQIEALLLINYIALSSDAVAYSPFPVIYDKEKNEEVTGAGKGLNSVIKCYVKWFARLQKSGMKRYDLPLIDKRYEWYGSLFQKQRVYHERPAWEKLYSCPVLKKERD
jgi:hypothetical protein